MAEDIVIRLRQGDSNCIDGHIYREWANEAADEIERLREQLAISKHECQMADDAVQDLQIRLIKAVRNGL